MAGHRNELNYTCPYKDLSTKVLEDLGTGIEEAFLTQIDLAEKQETVLSLLIKDFNKDFTELDHLPSPNIYVKESGSQYYYHAHHKEDRAEHEHGHFHNFLDLKVVAPDLIPEGYNKNRALTQIIGMSVTNSASIFRLFTTNAWVSDDVFVPAQKLIELIKSFSLKQDTRYPEVSTWVEGMLKGFMPHVCFLLEERDKALEAWRVEHNYETLEEALQDKKLEVPSSILIDILAHANSIEEELGGR